jgi:hypothetical protein
VICLDIDFFGVFFILYTIVNLAFVILSCNVCLENISQKANKTIGFLKRYLNIYNGKIKEKAYISLVRPTVEYASPMANT